MHGSMGAEGRVECRVCDLHVLYPEGAAVRPDGLYVVLRLGEDVHRTHCVWDSEAAEEGEPLHLTQLEWNEWVAFTVPAGKPGASTTGAVSRDGWGAAAAVGSSAAVSAAPHVLRNVGVLSGAPLAPPLQHPAEAAPLTLEVELWRSTAAAEKLLGRHALGLAAALAQPEALFDRVLPLDNASRYETKLGLRLRVRAVGLALPRPLPQPAAHATGSYLMPQQSSGGYQFKQPQQQQSVHGHGSGYALTPAVEDGGLLPSRSPYGFYPPPSTVPGGTLPGASPVPSSAPSSGGPTPLLNPVLARLLRDSGVLAGGGAPAAGSPSVLPLPSEAVLPSSTAAHAGGVLPDEGYHHPSHQRY